MISTATAFFVGIAVGIVARQVAVELIVAAWLAVALVLWLFGARGMWNYLVDDIE